MGPQVGSLPYKFLFPKWLQRRKEHLSGVCVTARITWMALRQKLMAILYRVSTRALLLTGHVSLEDELWRQCWMRNQTRLGVNA